MSWEHAKDNRTNEQVAIDFNYGKQNELIVFNKITSPKFLINEKDEIGVISKYTPDCFVFHTKKAIWVPVEIKFTEVEISTVDLKANQCQELARLGGYFLQSTPTRWCLHEAQAILDFCDYIEKGYCNKPVYRLDSPAWHNWNPPITNYVKKALHVDKPI